MKNRRSRAVTVVIILLILLVIGAIVFAGYRRQSNAASAKDAGKAPQVAAASAVEIAKPVMVLTAESRVIQGVVEALAEARPRRDAMIAADAVGRVIMIAEEGAHVRAGDVIARLDAARAGASVAASRARARATRADVNQKRRDVERQARLLEEGAVSTRDLDLARAALEAAEANLAAAEAGVDEVGASLANLVIKAPFAGIVLEKRVEIGEVVSPGAGLVRLGDISSLEVTSFIGEADLLKIDSGSAATVMFDAMPGESFPARVARVDRALADGARTGEVTVVLPNPAMKLPAGILARVAIMTERREGVIAIPTGAVRTGPEGRWVWIVSEDRAHVRMIETGLDGGGWVEITSGLVAGDIVVVRGAESIAEGDKVEQTPYQP